MTLVFLPAVASSILNDDFDDDSGYEEGNKAVKKSSLPKQSTAVMKAWLFQHIMVMLYLLIDSGEMKRKKIPLIPPP